MKEDARKNTAQFKENDRLIPQLNLDEKETSENALPEHANSLLISLALNFSRDLSWAMLTAMQVDLKFKIPKGTPSEVELQQTLAQWFYATLFMFIVLSAMSCYFKLRKWDTSTLIRHGVSSLAAASVAMWTWNYASYTLAQRIMEKYLFSEEAAGYVVAIAAGLAEGPTQYLAYNLCEKLFHYFSDTQKNTLTITQSLIKTVIAFILSATLGAIPGTVWQLIYNFGAGTLMGYQTAKKFWQGGILAISVAVSVCISNFIYAKVNEKYAERLYEYCRYRIFGLSHHSTEDEASFNITPLILQPPLNSAGSENDSDDNESLALVTDFSF